MESDPGFPGDDGSSSSSEDENDGPRKTPEEPELIRDRTSSLPTYQEGMFRPTERSQELGKGVQKIIKAFQGQTRFSGVYDEDLENIAEIYGNIADTCDVTPQEKRKAMYVMFKGTALSLFTHKG